MVRMPELISRGRGEADSDCNDGIHADVTTLAKLVVSLSSHVNAARIYFWHRDFVNMLLHSKKFPWQPFEAI